MIYIFYKFFCNILKLQIFLCSAYKITDIQEIIIILLFLSLGEFYTDSEDIKKKLMRSKAEEKAKNKSSSANNQSKDDLIHELLTHEIELEMQNDELKESQIKLEDSKHKYWELYDFAPIGYLTLDENGTINEINISGASLLNHNRSELIGYPFILFLTPESRTKFHQHIQNVAKYGKEQYCDLELIRTGKNPITAHIKTSYTNKNGTNNFRIALIDISQTKQAEDLKISLNSFSKINRTLIALRHSSYAMMHATNEISYLEEICKIVVDDCGYSMVWIGFAENDKNVRPVVYSGFEEDYLETLNIKWDDSKNGNGPTGKAIRTGKICICEDMQNDPKFEPWREEALKRGYASSICIPIANNEKTLGAITIYSTETNPFSEEEKELLTELAEDISYGLISIRLRIEQERTEIERETNIEFLRLINKSINTQELIHSALTFFKHQSGCEAVGIRIQEGPDYPYYETQGFPENFLLLENHLCEYDKKGNHLSNSKGNPLLACMCGNIICGRFDPSQQFFTDNGSFWTNSTSKLLSRTSEEDRQSRTRNRCNGEGYESVALIPLNSGGRNLGLLQLNDKRQNLFSEELISIWERLAGYLTVSLAKFKAEEETVRHIKVLDSINQVFQEALTCETEEEVVGKCLEVAEGLTDSEFGFFGEINEKGRLDYMAFTAPVWEACEIPNAIESIMDMEIVSYWGRTIKEEKSQIVNNPDSDPDRRGLPEGHPLISSFLGVPLKQGEKIIGTIALANKKSGYTEEDKNNVEDISGAFVEALMRKRAEIKINETKEELEVKVLERTKELKSANKYNRSLLEASLDPLVTIGPDGTITDVNHSTEKVTGFSRFELFGTDFSEYFTEPEKARKGYQKVFKEGFVLDYPLEIINKNGKSTPVLYNATIYKDEFNQVKGVFAAARDITKMKKAEKELKIYQDTLEEKVAIRTEELAKSNADLQHFAYVASHDLREPLRMITSFLQLLERRYNDKLDQDANEFIGFAVDGAKRLNDMINDLLEFSQVTSKERENQKVNLEYVIEETLINLKVQIQENNAVITHERLPVVNGDEKLLVNLFQNLIGNAIKYRSEKNPEIHISFKQEEHQYLFSVRDNGIGIDSEHLNRIFTIFQRLHRNDEYGGTGIGLAIVEKILDQHGGKIWAESELGLGTTFYFTIPI